MYEEHFNNQKGTIANNLFTLLMNFYIFVGVLFHLVVKYRFSELLF